MRRAGVRRWTLDERIAAKHAWHALVASGHLGKTEAEAARALGERIQAIRAMGDGGPATLGTPERTAFEAFFAEIDAVVPGASAALFPIDMQARAEVDAQMAPVGSA